MIYRIRAVNVRTINLFSIVCLRNYTLEQKKKKKKEVAQLNRWTEDRIRWPCLVLNGDEACVCNKKHNKSPSQMNDDIVYRKKKINRDKFNTERKTGKLKSHRENVKHFTLKQEQSLI